VAISNSPDIYFWDDTGYSSQLVDWVKVACDWFLGTVKRSENSNHEM
jgi:hypothetical protein